MINSIDTSYFIEKNLESADYQRRIQANNKKQNIEEFEKILLKKVYLESLIDKDEEEDEENDRGILSSDNSLYNEMLLDLYAQQLAKQDIFNLQKIYNKNEQTKSTEPNN